MSTSDIDKLASEDPVHDTISISTRREQMNVTQKSSHDIELDDPNQIEQTNKDQKGIQSLCHNLTAACLLNSHGR